MVKKTLNHKDKYFFFNTTNRDKKSCRNVNNKKFGSWKENEVAGFVVFSQ